MDEMPAASVLLVDDRPENIVALEQLLDEPGIRLISASSGDEALARLLDYDFAVVLLDVQMPGMDGFEVAQLMRRRARTRHIPIIFVTAINVEQQYVFRGYETGAVDYLFKPIVPEVLRSKVRVFCEMYRQKKALELEVEARQKAEAALAQSELRYRYLVELSPVAMCVLMGGQIQYANMPFLRLAGVEEREAVNEQLFATFFDEASQAKVREGLSEVERRLRRVELANLVFIRPDGQTLDAELGMNAVVYEGGTAIQVVLQDITARRRAEEEREKLITALQNALAEVKTLSGLLPICASCKKIRDDSGYWQQIEIYISSHSEAEFSHGLCPDCLKRLYPEYAARQGEQRHREEQNREGGVEA